MKPAVNAVSDPLLTFFVPGRSMPKGSPEIVPLRGRRTQRGKPKRIVREKEATVAWQRAVRLVARMEARKQGLVELIDDAVSMELALVLPRQKAARKSGCCVQWARFKPDLDKLVRAIGDALEGVAFTQDARITTMHATKRAAPHARPDLVGVRVSLGRDG